MQRLQEGLTKTYNRFHDPHERAEDIAALHALHAEMDRAVALAYGWGDLDLGHGFHQTRAAHALHHQRGGAGRKHWGGGFRLHHQRYADEERQGLHDKGSKGKKGRAARGSDTDDERQEATVRAPTLFDEDM
jgi:hypothetical protein